MAQLPNLATARLGQSGYTSLNTGYNTAKLLHIIFNTDEAFF
jgi:hypothetical protein